MTPKPIDDARLLHEVESVDAAHLEFTGRHAAVSALLIDGDRAARVVVDIKWEDDTCVECRVLDVCFSTREKLKEPKEAET